jgi:hypothetical protein
MNKEENSNARAHTHTTHTPKNNTSDKSETFRKLILKCTRSSHCVIRHEKQTNKPTKTPSSWEIKFRMYSRKRDNKEMENRKIRKSGVSSNSRERESGEERREEHKRGKGEGRERERQKIRERERERMKKIEGKK